MAIQAYCAPTEKEIAADLESRLGALTEDGRCEWRKEVRMLCWVQASRASPSSLRIDFVARLDGILVGFEVKKPPEKAADLGRNLLQCAQYAQGVIGGATADRIPQAWVGQQLLGVFLVTDSAHCSPFVKAHGQHAHRLFGPASVGFCLRNSAGCFELFMSSDRVWSKEWGWHRGVTNRTHRVGNGSQRTTDFSEVTVLEGTEHCEFVGAKTRSK